MRAVRSCIRMGSGAAMTCSEGVCFAGSRYQVRARPVRRQCASENSLLQPAFTTWMHWGE